MTPQPVQEVLDLSHGVRVRRWFADRPGMPALLLHGLSGTSWDWGRTVANLADAPGPIVAMDLPGFGGSRWRDAADYSLPRLAESCRRTMDELYPETPFAVVGHSFGGKVAIVLAASAPRSAARLVLVDAGIKVGPGQRATRERFGRQPATFPSFRAATEFFQDSYRFESEDVTRLRMLEYLESTADGVRVRRDPGFLAAAFASPTDEEQLLLAAQWAKIEAPARLIRGGASKMLTEEIATEMAEFGPSMTAVEFPGAGHNLPSQRPAELADELAWIWSEAPVRDVTR